MHINCLELKAILFELRLLCDTICNSYTKITCDNTIVVHRKLIWKAVGVTIVTELQNEFGTWLSKRLSNTYIPGKLDRKTDEES